MSNEELKNMVFKILDERKDMIIEQIEISKANIVSQLDEIININNFYDIEIPDSIKLASAEKNESDKINSIYTYIMKISAALNQINLINSLLEGINQFCNRAALFLVRDDKLVGWNGRGFKKDQGDIEDEEIKKVFFSLSADTTFKRVLESENPYFGIPSASPDDHLIYSRFGGRIPQKVLVIPFFVKGKPQAIIYADTFDDIDIGNKEIEIIAKTGELSLDLLPFRQKIISRLKTREFVEDAHDEVSKATVDETRVEEPITPPKKQSPTDYSTKPIKENDPARLARVIINDIVLYNQKVVEDGIMNKNLYNILQNTILQSKELYLKKFKDLTAFETELVENLARGDRDALKGYHFDAI
jgi:hypothetical protein